eukprot:12129636-Alexandrium_andersonii.AAC.1
MTCPLAQADPLADAVTTNRMNPGRVELNMEAPDCSRHRRAQQGNNQFRVGAGHPRMIGRRDLAMGTLHRP